MYSSIHCWAIWYMREFLLTPFMFHAGLLLHLVTRIGECPVIKRCNYAHCGSFLMWSLKPKVITVSETVLRWSGSFVHFYNNNTETGYQLFQNFSCVDCSKCVSCLHSRDRILVFTTCFYLYNSSAVLCQYFQCSDFGLLQSSAIRSVLCVDHS